MLYDELLSEFREEENTFLYVLKKKLIWKHERFKELAFKMIEYCKEEFDDENELKGTDGSEISKGFWKISWFIKEWSGYDEFRRINPKPKVYYDLAYEVIESIAYWYFSGECPTMKVEDLERRIEKLEKYRI